MIAWIGVGFALISSILFSCAAICLRREREKEEAVNMQYLMPGNIIVFNIYLLLNVILVMALNPRNFFFFNCSCFSFKMSNKIRKKKGRKTTVRSQAVTIRAAHPVYYVV